MSFRIYFQSWCWLAASKNLPEGSLQGVTLSLHMYQIWESFPGGGTPLYLTEMSYHVCNHISPSICFPSIVDFVKVNLNYCSNLNLILQNIVLQFTFTNYKLCIEKQFWSKIRVWLCKWSSDLILQSNYLSYKKHVLFLHLIIHIWFIM